MGKLVRCKSCGFITRSASVKEVCPACGVPARMMEPYTDPLSEKRRRFALDIHPVSEIQSVYTIFLRYVKIKLTGQR